MQAQPVHLLNLLNGDVQYKIPRWQRRYCWGQEDIERLIEDLKTIAASQPGSTHYTGTLLTLHENVPAGSVSIYRVVDGQQRLTTVSILLACIAELIGDDQQVGEWTKTRILNKRLLNQDVAHSLSHKLRLQPEDHVEYADGLKGKPTGSGAVTQAWRITRRLLAKADLEQLITGIERLQVVSIGLNIADDPQQIFESINATGRPLTESEKVKNWLLIGLPEDQQNDLYEHDWRSIESSLGADQTSQPIDVFLRDFLRYQTGENKGIERVYDEFRRWAIRSNKHQNRPELCHELAYLAKLYGYITGTAGTHPDKGIERELKHLRRMSIDTHRPFTLRLMVDSERLPDRSISLTLLAETLSYVSAWITRLWLADRSMTSLSTAFINLAYYKTPQTNELKPEYWRQRICARRNSKIGVPTDEEVRNGIATRSAYGGSASYSTFAVLCALMLKEHGSEPIESTQLSIEHVMPQKLTDEWMMYLGEEAESIHAQSQNRLGNLTLCGDEINSQLGARAFEEKKRIYERSPIGMTKRIAIFDRWDEESITHRGKELADKCLALWSWQDTNQSTQVPQNVPVLQWRMNDDDWHYENSGRQMVLNVLAALLDIEPTNESRLAGKAKHSEVQLASEIPPRSKQNPKSRFFSIPRHPHLVAYPDARNYDLSAEKCRRFGERCNVNVEIQNNSTPIAPQFWQKLKESTGGVPGQKDDWHGKNQYSSVGIGDRIGISLLADRTLMYIKSRDLKEDISSIERMKRHSKNILDNMSDQPTTGDTHIEAIQGRSLAISRTYELEDTEEWNEAVNWIQDQCTRLNQIIESDSSQKS